MRMTSFLTFAALTSTALFLGGCGSDAVVETQPDDAATGADTSSSGGDGAATADNGTATDGTSGGDTTTAADTASSGDTATGGSDAKPSPSDAAVVSCGTKTCTGGQVCCVSGAGGGATATCATSCADGGVPIGCDGPEDCTGGGICCATVQLEGAGLACTFKQGSAECKSTCTSTVTPACPSTATIRPCHAAADCPEAGYNKCCTFERNGTKAQFCASPTLALAANGGCL